MSDAIRLASHAYHYLTVFNRHTEIPLYLGRARRCASPGQRIVLYARDRGCTRPGCTVPPYWCQAHHADPDWAQDGHTNITDLTLACGPDNLAATEDGWTRKRHDGRIEWVPPPHLHWGHLPIAGDGQPPINHDHHPQEHLTEDDEPE